MAGRCQWRIDFTRVLQSKDIQIASYPRIIKLMRLAAITKPGLGAMAILVAVLWGCLVNERLTIQKADVELAQTMHEIRTMQTKVHQAPALPERALRARTRPAQS
jgi:hypothetical protein